MGETMGIMVNGQSFIEWRQKGLAQLFNHLLIFFHSTNINLSFQFRRQDAEHLHSRLLQADAFLPLFTDLNQLVSHLLLFIHIFTGHILSHLLEPCLDGRIGKNIVGACVSCLGQTFQASQVTSVHTLFDIRVVLLYLSLSSLQNGGPFSLTISKLS